jgi:hypothetical protein
VELALFFRTRKNKLRRSSVSRGSCACSLWAGALVVITDFQALEDGGRAGLDPEAAKTRGVDKLALERTGIYVAAG